MPTVPFSVPATSLAAGPNVILNTNGQPFQMAANWSYFLVNIFPAGAWQHRTPENAVEYRVERDQGQGNWVLWGSGLTEEGLLGKGGAAGNVTLGATGRAEQARIVIVCDQAIPAGVTISGQVIT